MEGTCPAVACPAGAPQYGGSWRRCAVRTGQRPGRHCRPSHWLVLAVIGAPAEAQRSGFGGERRPSGGNELSGLPGSERSVAWADDAAPRAARIGITPQALKAVALYRPGPPGRRRCLASEISGWLLWLGNGASGMPRPTISPAKKSFFFIIVSVARRRNFWYNEVL